MYNFKSFNDVIIKKIFYILVCEIVKKIIKILSTFLVFRIKYGIIFSLVFLVEEKNYIEFKVLIS